MSYVHGISVDVDRVDGQIFLECTAIGTLTHADYEKIMPVLDEALEGIEEPVVNAYIDGANFEGWELHAAWDELNLGVKHGRKMKKVAFYGTSHWQEVMSKVGNWFIAGEFRYFDEPLDALSWLRDGS